MNAKRGINDFAIKKRSAETRAIALSRYLYFRLQVGSLRWTLFVAISCHNGYAIHMLANNVYSVFLVSTPGLESTLCAGMNQLGYLKPRVTPGGVSFEGGWPDIWRANLELRGAVRVLVRIAEFRAMHLAQLDKRARKVDWLNVLRPDLPVKVEATCRKSRIYHAGAAAQRVQTALTDGAGIPVNEQAAQTVRVRIEDDLCTISIDTTGEPLYKRGHKTAVGKAPIREKLAAMFLREAGFTGAEPVVDPMCGSGTLVIEAAEIAMGLQPGRSRHFAFEQLASFDKRAFDALRSDRMDDVPFTFHGSDRDAGAVKMATDNVVRAGLEDHVRISQSAVSDLTPPDGPTGLVISNPPYGARIGNKKLLYAVYGAFGKTLKERFSGWRAAIITSDGALAKATGLPDLQAGPPIPHGGLKVRLYRSGRLP